MPDKDKQEVKQVHLRNRGVAPVVVYDELSRPQMIEPGQEKKIVMNEGAAKFFEKHSHKDKRDVLEHLGSSSAKSLRDEDPEEEKQEPTPEQEQHQKMVEENRKRVEDDTRKADEAAKKRDDEERERRQTTDRRTAAPARRAADDDDEGKRGAPSRVKP